MSKTKLLALDAATVFTPRQKFSPGRLLIEGKTIVAAGTPESVQLSPETEIVDARAFDAVPGFIEPHIHGCGGADVMDGTYESLNAVSRIAARHGITSFLPTTVSSPPETLAEAVRSLGAMMSGPFDGATPLGIHLEGPFISVAKRGTHKAANLRPPDAALLEKWVRESGHTVRLVTIAPELPGADLLRAVAGHLGLIVAMGHSNATLEETRNAIDLGICYAVHTFNAMRGFSHRDPGIAGAILADDRIFAEIIADGIHVDPDVVRIFARAKGTARVLLGSDAISATDMPDGEYRLGSELVRVVNGVCRDAEGRLAGSTLTPEIALRNFTGWTGWSMDDALRGLTLNPAAVLRLPSKGRLEPGADADIAVLDQSFRVMKTFVEGRLVFERAP